MNILLLGFLLPIAAWMVAGFLQQFLLYNFRTYNCEAMSFAQKKIFKFFGLDAETWEGDFAKSPQARSHTWPKVGKWGHMIHWESTRLLPLNPTRSGKLTNIRRITGEQEVR